MDGKRTRRPNRILVLRGMLLSPYFIASFVVASILYYLLIKYVIEASSSGVFFLTVPIYLLYLLSMSSGFLLSTSIYSVGISMRYGPLGVGDGAASAALTLVGGLVTSCGCTTPLLATVLYSIGANALSVGGAISFVSANQDWMLSAVILLNAAFVYYSLGKVSRGCTIGPGGRLSARA